MSAATGSRARRTSPLAAHAPFAVALLAGMALRVVVMVAYRPALLFPDSFRYLNQSEDLHLDPDRPAGYSWLLKSMMALTGSLTGVSAVQHLFGIALAIACYIFLVRRDVAHWAATLAALPVLLDPLQLVLEDYVLSDVLFEGLLVSACLAVLWRNRPGYLAMATAGLLCSCAGLVRGAGTLIIAIFLVALLCLRVQWRKVAVFILSAAVPVIPYVIAFHDAYGTYGVTSYGPRFLYARIAPKIYCPGLDLPSYEQALCPEQPLDTRPDTNYFMWHVGSSPQWFVAPPRGMTQLQMVKDFDRRVVRAEPLTYSKAVLVDLAGGFAPTRTYEVPGYAASSWLFADHYWSMDPWVLDRSTDYRPLLRNAKVDKGPARFLAGYRHWIWTPGPLMALLLLVAAAAVGGFGRARRSGDRVAVGLLAGSCFMTLATGAAVSGFSWRYQLPQLPLLPTAGALAIAAFLRGRHAATPPEVPRLAPLERTAEVLASMSPVLRPAVERGALQTSVAMLIGVVLAVVSAASALASGWVAFESAALGGLCLGVIAVVLLLGARRRARLEALPEHPAPSSAPEPVDVMMR